VEAENALLTGSCVGYAEDSTLLGALLGSDDAKWAAFEAPLPVQDLLPWGIAVTLDELDSDWGDFLRQSVRDWHRSGFLIALETQWKLPASDFLARQQAAAQAAQ